MNEELSKLTKNLEDNLQNLYDIQNILIIIRYAMDYCNNEGEDSSPCISIINILLDKMDSHIAQMDEYLSKLLRYNLLGELTD